MPEQIRHAVASGATGPPLPSASPPAVRGERGERQPADFSGSLLGRLPHQIGDAWATAGAAIDTFVTVNGEGSHKGCPYTDSAFGNGGGGAERLRIHGLCAQQTGRETARVGSTRTRCSAVRSLAGPPPLPCRGSPCGCPFRGWARRLALRRAAASRSESRAWRCADAPGCARRGRCGRAGSRDASDARARGASPRRARRAASSRGTCARRRCPA